MIQMHYFHDPNSHALEPSALAITFGPLESFSIAWGNRTGDMRVPGMVTVGNPQRFSLLGLALVRYLGSLLGSSVNRGRGSP